MRAQTSRSEASSTPEASSPDPIGRGKPQAHDGIVDRICTCLVEGLMHCACSHNHANPELAACIHEVEALHGRSSE